MTVINPDSVLIREPNLLVPGVQPFGPVKLNNAHYLVPDYCINTLPGKLIDMRSGESVSLGTNNVLKTFEGVRGLDCGGSALTGDFSCPSLASSATWTIIMRVRFPTLEAVHRFAGFGTYSPGFATRLITNDYLSIYHGGWLTSSYVVSDNTWLTLGFLFSSGQVDYYVDGIYKEAASFSPQARAAGYHLGGSAVAFEEPAFLEYSYIWDRGLSAKEILSISSDPYQIFVPS